MKVFERVLTICGETHLAGMPCALIRFAGCELRCRWCDTVEAREPTAAVMESDLEELVDWAAHSQMRLVLLTGGEPLLQPELPELAARLARQGQQVLVETSGAHDIGALEPPVIRSVDVKCPSSGESGRNRWENLRLLRAGDVVKMVVADREDYAFAKRVIATHGLCSPVNILLSSAYPQLKPEQLATWIVEDRLGEVRLNVQLHRLLWPALEQRQGG
jgi:7-carboxy-7-deazaguanine synthase